MFKRIMAVLGLALLLAGCGGVEQEPTELPSLTLVPPPTPYVEGQCDVISDLESWLQATDFRRQDFQTTVNALDGKTRSEIFAETERLSQIVITISQSPSPDCAEGIHNMLLNVMNTTVDGLQAYVNGDRDDLNMVIASNQHGFEMMEADFEALGERLTAQFEERIQQLTQTP